MIGDSITFAYGNYVLHRVEDPISPLYGVSRWRRWEVVNLGQGGERSAAGLARIRELLRTTAAPDVAVVLYGANDVFVDRVAPVLRFPRESGYDTAQIEANILEIKRILEERGSAVVIGFPFMSTHRVPEDLPLKARRIARALARGYADLRAALIDDAPTVDLRTARKCFVDHVHPNEKGKRLIAVRARAAVRRQLARRELR